MASNAIKAGRPVWLVGLAAAMVLAVVANVIVARHYKRWDWTKSKRYSLTTATVSTLHEVFKLLDVAAFEAALARWAQAALAPSSQAIALDGKALRGIHGEELPGVRLVAAYDVETGLVLVQQGGQDQDAQHTSTAGVGGVL